jgi:hypothetical protein
MTTIIPHANTKLNTQKRLRLANLACGIFIDHEGRAETMRLLNLFTESFARDAEAIPETEVAFLRRYNIIGLATRIRMPNQIRASLGMKIFEVGEKTVEREEFKTLRVQRDFDGPTIVGWSRWSDALNPDSIALDQDTWRQPVVDLPRPVWVPTLNNGIYEGVWPLSEEKSALSGQFISTETTALMVQLYRVHNQRLQTEKRLMTAVVVMLNQAKTVAEVIEFFPEAAEHILEIFGPEPLRTRALAVLNEEDVALVCNHMSRRGVVSTLCQGMLSPALAAE